MPQMVKHLPRMQETQVQSLGWADPLEKEMATYSSTLAWKIPWTVNMASCSAVSATLECRNPLTQTLQRAGLPSIFMMMVILLVILLGDEGWEMGVGFLVLLWTFHKSSCF